MYYVIENVAVESFRKCHLKTHKLKIDKVFINMQTKSDKILL